MTNQSNFIDPISGPGVEKEETQKEDWTVEFKSLTPEQKRQLDNLFMYHAPKGNQLERYQIIREAGRKLAYAIIANTPASADQTAAIRKVREAVMTANAAIACNE